MERNYEKILFDFTHSNAPMFCDNFCIVDITGNSATSKNYRVFLKGGICFEISHEPGAGEFEYDFVSYWEGPFGSNTAQHILAVFTMLGHSFTDKFKASQNPQR